MIVPLAFGAAGLYMLAPMIGITWNLLYGKRPEVMPKDK
jgi:hypothetical protein